MMQKYFFKDFIETERERERVTAAGGAEGEGADLKRTLC